MAALVLSSCNKEERLEPSYMDKDWSVIEDNPDDDVQHQRYLLYKDRGIALYFTDTLGSSERYNYAGEKIDYYHILRVGYLLNGASNSDYSFKFLPQPSATHTERLEMFNFLKSEVIEKLPEGYMPQKVLVANTFEFNPTAMLYIKNPLYSGVVGGVMLVGNLPKMPSQMAALHKKRAINKIKATALAYSLMISEDEQISQLVEDFFRVTNSVNEDPANPYDFYGQQVPPTILLRNGTPDSPWHYGLLYTGYYDVDLDGVQYGYNAEWYTIWTKPTDNTRRFITAETDLTDYLVLYFEKTKAEVELMYDSYAAIKTKFGIIEQLMEAVLP